MSRCLSTSRRGAAAVTVATVTGALVLTATPAVAADTTGPALTGVAIVGGDSYTANVTHNATQVGVLISATDDQSGVSDADVTLTCTSACSGSGVTTAEADGFSLSGPPTNVSGVVSITIPQTAQTGGWQVTSVTLTDNDNNQTAITDAPTLGVHRSFTVAKTADNNPPAVSAITLAGPSVDVTTADKDVALTVHATDAVAGVADGSVTLICNTGCDNPGDTREFDFDSSNQTTGTPLSGTWTTNVNTFSQFDIGTWTLDSIDIEDAYGNHQTSTAGLSVNLAVTETADGTGPGVTGTPSFDAPGSVNVTRGDATINLTATITDNISGFSSGFGTLSDGVDSDLFFSFDRSNNTTGNTYVIPITVPARQPAGSYAFNSVTLSDRAGNDSNPDTSSWPSLTVTDTADSTGPSISGVTFGPSTLNVFDNFHSAFINANITDSVSGFTSADGHFTDPSGNPVEVDGLISSGNLVSGDSTSGHYVAQFNPPFWLPSGDLLDGTWTLNSVDLHDLANNTTSSVAVNKSIVVTDVNPHDASAPTLTSITLSETSVNTTAHDGTFHVQIHVKDTGGSGFNGGFVEVDAPGNSGNSAPDGSFGVGQLSSGDDTDGTYDFDMTIPQYSVNGHWPLTEVFLEDNTGNEDDVTGSTLFGIAGSQGVDVTGPIDITAPKLVSISASPTSVTTTTDGTVNFTLHATDNAASNDGSGVTGGEVTLTSPTGKLQTVDFDTFLDLTSGTPQNATVQTSITLPKFAETGTWSVSVDLFDRLDNESSYAPGDVAALPSSTSTISVTGATDSHAPVVSALSFVPGSVSTATGAQPLVVLAHVTDDQATNDGSGVESLNIDLASPNGSQPDFADNFTLVAGDDTDGWWETGFNVPKFVDTGTWTITSLEADDNVGNDINYDSAALTTAGLPTGVSITGPADSAAPVLVTGGVTLPATTTDVTATDQQINVGLHLQDGDGSGATNGSGVASGSVVVEGPNGATELGFLPDNPTTGVTTDGVWNVPITIHKFTDNGTWHLQEVDLQDVFGNQVQLIGADFAGDTTTFQVHSNPDTSAPVLTSLSFNPTSVNVTSGSALVTFTVGVTDTGSGFDGGSIDLSIAGGGDAFGTIGSAPITGNPNAGTFTGTVTIPQFAKPGTWNVTDLELEDVVGNFVEYPTPTPFPSGGGITTTLGVTDTNADTSPPAVAAAGISISPTPVDLSGGQQQVTFNFELTDDKSGVVTGGSFDLKSPSGAVQSIQLNNLATGTPNDGHWIVQVPFGVHSENGVWTISAVDISDAANNTAHITTVPTTNSFTVENGIASAPGAPQNVTGTVGNTSVTLNWDPPSSNGGAAISDYDVKISPHRSGHSDPDVVTVGSNNTEKVVSGLTNGIGYTFQVAAVNSQGPGNYSSSSATLTPQPVAPSPPTNVMGTPQDGAVALTWTASSDTGGSPITGYHVQYSNDNGATWHDASASFESSTSTSGTVSGLTNGTAYVFQVAAINTSGTGGYSDQSASVTPEGSASKDATALSIGAAKTIKYGGGVTISTVLRDTTTSNSAIVGAPVQLMSRPGTSGTFKPVGSALTTSSGGTAAKTVKPTVNTQYEWSYAGDATHSASTSKAQTISVAQVVTAKLKPGTVKHKKPAKIYGLVKPNEAGQKVVLQQLVKGKWKSLKVTATIKTQALPGSSKKVLGYILTIKEPKKGTYTFRVSRAKTAKNAAGVSNTVKLKVT